MTEDLAAVWEAAYEAGYADCKVGAEPKRQNPYKHEEPLHD